MKTLLTSLLLTFLLLPTLAEPVPGMGIDLPPPEGFTATSKFAGFEHDESESFIMVHEVPGEASFILSCMTKEACASSGITLTNRETVNDLTFLTVEQYIPDSASRIEKQILFLGDGERTLVITGGYPLSSVESFRQPIRQALLASKVVEESEQDKLEAFSFTWEPNARLKFESRFHSTAVLGLEEDDSESVHVFIAPSRIRVEGKDPAIVGKNALLKDNDYDDFKIVSQQAVEANYPASELIAQGKDKTLGEEVRIYQLLLLDSSGHRYLRVLAEASPEVFEEWLPTFREVAESLKFVDK